MATRYFIGMMSGTSLDGVDTALVKYESVSFSQVHQHFLPYPDALKNILLDLHHPAHNELHQAQIVSNQLALLYAQAVNALLAESRLTPADISAIGCHGQTIRHNPQTDGDIGYTIQLGNHALLAELTNITVVGDFRTRDIAAGGQGAPLVPAFHLAVFGDSQTTRTIVNIGGIANVSYLPAGADQQDVLGFDTGPGNMLIDYWVKKHLGLDYDAGGAWCASGEIIPNLLTRLLAEPYFALKPPKSTGRDLFHAAWLEQHLKVLALEDAKPQDVARTLLALTAISVSEAIQRDCPNTNVVYVCGGGAHNHALMTQLSELLKLDVLTTEALGVGVDWVEAVAFAWLAQRCIDRLPGNMPAVTGAKGARVLGAIYPRS